MVVARSDAEMPVPMPFRASTVTVYAVPCLSWFTAYMGNRPSRSQMAPSSGTHRYPEV
ncbi:Uncharacterised protein [Mycobacterium tuberculosis]|nr:Uncharacterised protein [Mycobacterium tuberculosis]